MFANISYINQYLLLINRMQGPYREILSPNFKVQIKFARTVRKERVLSISRHGMSNPVNK